MKLNITIGKIMWIIGSWFNKIPRLFIIILDYFQLFWDILNYFRLFCIMLLYIILGYSKLIHFKSFYIIPP
jgi:hypothetical protein